MANKSARLSHIDVRHASTDVYRDGFHLETILFFCDGEAHDAGLAVEGLRGVEDEVADAVVDLVTVIVLDGLEGVGVMADEHIGSSVYQHVGIVTLTRHGLQCMFASPVKRDDDDGCGVRSPEAQDAR